MSRKNIASRPDIAPDALRQRRDLYLIAIGLAIYYLAGGSMTANTAFGSILPISLERPGVLLIAAWIAFFYFWFRFYLVSEGEPFAKFWEDVCWQAGNTSAFRYIAKEIIPIGSGFIHVTADWPAYSYEDRISAVEKISVGGRGKGYIVFPQFAGLKPALNLSRAASRGNNGAKGSTLISMPVGPAGQLLPRRLSIKFIVGLSVGLFRALARERSFTDDLLPHFFAIATVLIAIQS